MLEGANENDSTDLFDFGKAWALEQGKLVDFKVEFGFNSSGKLLLADVIDKQVYRDGGTLDKVSALYRHVSNATDHFKKDDRFANLSD
jgi:phosphoribosylaminoimidazole-succinocarboxamide synthase